MGHNRGFAHWPPAVSQSGVCNGGTEPPVFRGRVLPCVSGGKKDHRRKTPAWQRRFHRRPAVPAACLLFIPSQAGQQSNRTSSSSALPPTPLVAASGELASRERACAGGWVRACRRRSSAQRSTTPPPSRTPSRARLDGRRRRAFHHALDLRGDSLADLRALPSLPVSLSPLPHPAV
jgi:hypothetical protein